VVSRLIFADRFHLPVFTGSSGAPFLPPLGYAKEPLCTRAAAICLRNIAVLLEEVSQSWVGRSSFFQSAHRIVRGSSLSPMPRSPLPHSAFVACVFMSVFFNIFSFQMTISFLAPDVFSQNTFSDFFLSPGSCLSFFASLSISLSLLSLQ